MMNRGERSRTISRAGIVRGRLILPALLFWCCVARRDPTGAREALAAFMDARMTRDQLRAEGYLTERGRASYIANGMSLTGASNLHFDRYELLRIGPMEGDSVVAGIRITEAYAGRIVHTMSFVERIVLVERQGAYFIDRVDRVSDRQ